MNSWQSGRRELLEDLAKLCDKVRANVENELHDENSILVSRDEFRKLQKTNTIVGKLENDFIGLSREQEEAQSDARLVQEKTAEIERLNKENARLTEELKPYKSAAVQAQAGQSEEQHQLLSTEIQPVQDSQDI
ncbi:hypothetical protein OIDMADRAFT_17259, partial [Oidiodendron maius Zn]